MKEPVRPEIKARRKFDANFKRQAVGLWMESGRSATEMAQELGIRPHLLYNWKGEFAPPAAPPKPADLQTQVEFLRRENALLRQQREVLKKTLGILSDLPSNATNGFTR